MNTFYQMWGVTTPEEARLKIEEQRRVALVAMKRSRSYSKYHQIWIKKDQQQED